MINVQKGKVRKDSGGDSVRTSLDHVPLGPPRKTKSVVSFLEHFVTKRSRDEQPLEIDRSDRFYPADLDKAAEISASLENIYEDLSPKALQELRSQIDSGGPINGTYIMDDGIGYPDIDSSDSDESFATFDRQRMDSLIQVADELDALQSPRRYRREEIRNDDDYDDYSESSTDSLPSVVLNGLCIDLLTVQSRTEPTRQASELYIPKSEEPKDPLPIDNQIKESSKDNVASTIREQKPSWKQRLSVFNALSKLRRKSLGSSKPISDDGKQALKRKMRANRIVNRLYRDANDSDKLTESELKALSNMPAPLVYDRDDSAPLAKFSQKIIGEPSVNELMRGVGVNQSDAVEIKGLCKETISSGNPLLKIIQFQYEAEAYVKFVENCIFEKVEYISKNADDLYNYFEALSDGFDRRFPGK
ncbi:hypothetical protein ACOME3_000985 [Neoechinorhynchus agilis]